MASSNSKLKGLTNKVANAHYVTYIWLKIKEHLLPPFYKKFLLKFFFLSSANPV